MPTYGAASYGTAMPTYGTSYGATPMYGGYGGYGGAHPMDVATVETQKADAMNVLSTQFGVQEKMLDHQHETQLKVLEAEKTRMVEQMTTQYDQQYMQQKLAIEQAYKQQHSQLTMAKTQREMAIQQQAAQMTAQATQYQ